MKLTNDQVSAYHETIRGALDPKSPFRGKVDFADLMAMPIPVQQQIYDAMPDDLRRLVESE